MNLKTKCFLSQGFDWKKHSNLYQSSCLLTEVEKLSANTRNCWEVDSNPLIDFKSLEIMK